MKGLFRFFAAIAAAAACAGVILLAGFLSSRRLVAEDYSCGLIGNVTVAHLSDLHIPNCGIKKEKITELLRERRPTFIVLTGDMLDGGASEGDLEEVRSFYFSLTELSPVYAVIGNHEIGSELLKRYKRVCLETGVKLLVDSSVTVSYGGRTFFIYGANDGCEPDEPRESDIKLLLAHRPELIKKYLSYDVVFAGHTHGGQVRLFGRGLYAPDQGYFPEYDAGRFVCGDTQMFVSRGLGDGSNKFRIFNPYNILFVTI